MTEMAPLYGTLMTAAWRDTGTIGTFVLIEDVQTVKKNLRDLLDSEEMWFEFQAFDGETYIVDVFAVLIWSLEVVNLADPSLPSTESRPWVNEKRKQTRQLLEGKAKVKKR